MPDSDLIFIEGEPVTVGQAGDHDFEFDEGESVTDAGDSEFVFVEGTGMGGGIIIDDFEDGDLSEYSGATGDYSVTGSAAYEGSYGIALGDNAGSIFSTSGLDAYPEAGDTFNCRINNNGSSAHTRFFYGVQDSNNYYTVEPDNRPGTTENGIQQRKYSGGNVEIKKEKETGNIPNNEWMKPEVDWGTGGTITFTLYDASDNALGTLSMNDTEYTDGGIGWGMAGTSGQNVYYDFARKVA